MKRKSVKLAPGDFVQDISNYRGVVLGIGASKNHEPLVTVLFESKCVRPGDSGVFEMLAYTEGLKRIRPFDCPAFETVLKARRETTRIAIKDLSAQLIAIDSVIAVLPRERGKGTKAFKDAIKAREAPKGKAKKGSKS